MQISTEMTRFPSNGREMPGYLARPEGEGPFPGLVIIQEWWGLVPHIKDVARRFAAEGYMVLAPDLYHGEAAQEPDEARKLAMKLERDRAVTEIVAAGNFLLNMDLVSGQQVGLVGWCMGGGLALSTAAESDVPGAVVCFYGRPLDEADTANVRAPILGLYGSEDRGIPPADVREFEAALRASGIVHEILIYDGAQHAFFNDTRAAYDAQAAADAWQRTLAWFATYLRGDSGAAE
ncbi:MAG: dienelactone hydrolase family protein [Candidatus Promineifilaceae bacterium]|nr:dienelactone hydrolase family protein [Candidatus Promineifilaceae bacterium]